MTEYINCQCGKIVSQLEDNRIVIIKCRRCKRYVILDTKGLNHIRYKLDDEIVRMPQK